MTKTPSATCKLSFAITFTKKKTHNLEIKKIFELCFCLDYVVNFFKFLKGSTENAVVRYQSRYQRYCSKIRFVVSTAFSVHFWKVPHFPYKANRGTNFEEF